MAKRQRPARTPDRSRATMPPAADVRVWMPLSIVAAAIALYVASLPAPYLPDDQRSIVENRTLQSLTAALAPPRDTPVAGRPLVNLSFALNYAAGGLDVRGYRAVNVALHAAAALLLFGLVRRTMLLYRPEQAVETPGAAWIGWLSAMLWLVHPLQTESVVYLSQRSELMMGIAYLAALYCHARGWKAAVIVTCALGMLCKESMVTAPVAIVLYDRVFRFTSWRDAIRANRGFYAGVAATWLVLAAMLASAPRTSVGFEAGVSAWTYFLNQCQVLGHYFKLVVWPTTMVWDYGLPRALSPADVWPQAVALTVLFAAAVVLLFRRPAVGVLLFWVFLTLSPTSSIVPIATEVGAERRMYLPLAGLTTLAVVAILAAGRGLAPRIRYALVLVLCAALAGASYWRAQDYQSLRALAETTVERWPNPRGQFQLAVVLYEEEQSRAEAVRLMQLAAPEFAGARFALGIHYVSENRLADAVPQLEGFLRAMPNHANAVAARDVLGRIFLSQGRVAEAIQHFDAVLQFPQYPQRPQVLQLRQQAEAMRGRS